MKPLSEKLAGCWKRRFLSKSHARRANARAGFRLRVYWCELGCAAYHVANADKRRARP